MCVWWWGLHFLLTVYLNPTHTGVFVNNYSHVLFIRILFKRTVVRLHYVTVFQYVIAGQVAVTYVVCAVFSVFIIQAKNCCRGACRVTSVERTLVVLSWVRGCLLVFLKGFWSCVGCRSTDGMFPAGLRFPTIQFSGSEFFTSREPLPPSANPRMNEPGRNKSDFAVIVLTSSRGLFSEHARASRLECW